MNANDKTEKVLRDIHILLSKSEPYNKEPSKVIVDKQQMIDLLANLNKCIYEIQDEYELTEQSRNHAEREFRKKGDQIVWDASRKAEDVYAASVMYTDEALSRVRDIINETNESLEQLCRNMREKIADQEHIVKTNQLELKGQLQDLSDTEKYLKIIEDRNREIQRQKDAGKPIEEQVIDNDKSIYANRQTEVKVNTDYLRKLGLAEGEDFGDGVVENSLKTVEPDVKSDAIEKALESQADEEADLVKNEENINIGINNENEPSELKKEVSELTDGIHKMWQSLTGKH
ncbi:hypothetical protein [Agathobacter sp.]